MSEQQRTDTLRLPSDVRRLVVLGDPHGDLIGLELALEREGRPGVAIASAGDNVGYADGTVSSYMCQLLAERKIPSVFGNHEEWSRDGKLTIAPPGMSRELTPEALEWCRALPYRIRIKADALPSVTISLVHSFPDWGYVNADSARRLTDLEDAHVVFCGHTHRPAIYTLGPRARRAKVLRLDPVRREPLEVRYEPGKRYVVDAGSLARPSKPRRGMCEGRGTYAAFDLESQTLQLYSVDKGPRLRELFEQWASGPPSASDPTPHTAD